MVQRKVIENVLPGLVAISILVFYLLALIGCISTSPGLPGIFLIKLANNETKAEVTIGLFGLCAGAGSNMTCAATVGTALANETAKALLPGTTTVASTALQPLLFLANAIQSNITGPGGVFAIIYVPLLASALCFVAAAGSLVAYHVFSRGADKYEDASVELASHEKDFKHERNAWRLANMLTTGAASTALAAAIASTVAVRALLFAGTVLPGRTNTTTGTTAIVVTGGVSLQVLQWLIVAFTLLWHPRLTTVWRKSP